MDPSHSLEITSAGTSDTEEISWGWTSCHQLVTTSYKPFLLPLSMRDGVIVPNNGFDPSGIDFMRMYGKSMSNRGMTLSWRNARIVYPKEDGYYDLFDGLIGYWDLQGNPNEVTRYHDAIVSGATLTTDRFGFASGAYLFASSTPTAHLMVPATTYPQDFNIGTGDFTVLAMWQYNLAWTDLYHTLCEMGLYTNGFLFRYNTSGQLGMYLQYAVGADLYVTNYHPIDGQPHMDAFVRKDKAVHFVNDGVATTTSSASAQNINITGTSGLTIGRSNHSPGQCIANPIDFVMLFNRALDDAEINAIYRLALSKDIYEIVRGRFE